MDKGNTIELDSCEVQAKTIDLAIEQACAQLGASYDEVDVEILSEGGFLRKPKVRVTRKTTQKPAAQEKPSAVSNIKADIRTEKGAENKPTTKTEVHTAPGPINKFVPRPTGTPQKEDIKVEPIADAPFPKKQRNTTDSKNAQPIVASDGQMPVKFQKALIFTKKLLELLENDSTVTSATTEKNFEINIDGENVGMVIGKGGEVMNAIQTLVSSIAIFNSNGEQRRVNVNVKDYKERRVETLKNLALKKAEKVKTSGRYIKLNPMNARDRAIVHSALQNIEGIKTYSTGKEPHRCLCIAPKTNTDETA